MTQIAMQMEFTSYAIDLDRRLAESAEQTWELLYEAHQNEIWKVLTNPKTDAAYKSWKQYITDRFDISKSYSYRLLDQAKVNKALREANGESRQLATSVTENEARIIKPHLDNVVEDIKEGTPPDEAVQKAVKKAKAEKAKRGEVVDVPDETQVEPTPDGPDLIRNGAGDILANPYYVAEVMKAAVGRSPKKALSGAMYALSKAMSLGAKSALEGRSAQELEFYADQIPGFIDYLLEVEKLCRLMTLTQAGTIQTEPNA